MAWRVKGGKGMRDARVGLELLEARHAHHVDEVDEEVGVLAQDVEQVAAELAKDLEVLRLLPLLAPLLTTNTPPPRHANQSSQQQADRLRWCGGQAGWEGREADSLLLFEAMVHAHAPGG